MKYIEDQDFKYKDELIQTLRDYNSKYIGERESSAEYFYAVDGDKLVGAVYTNFHWDWVGLGSVFYEDTEILKKLISEISDYYKNKAVGLKHYTEVDSRIEDFKSIGFDVGPDIVGQI